MHANRSCLGVIISTVSGNEVYASLCLDDVASLLAGDCYWRKEFAGRSWLLLRDHVTVTSHRVVATVHINDIYRRAGHVPVVNHRRLLAGTAAAAAAATSRQYICALMSSVARRPLRCEGRCALPTV